MPLLKLNRARSRARHPTTYGTRSIEGESETTSSLSTPLSNSAIYPLLKFNARTVNVATCQWAILDQACRLPEPPARCAGATHSSKSKGHVQQVLRLGIDERRCETVHFLEVIVYVVPYLTLGSTVLSSLFLLFRPLLVPRLVWTRKSFASVRPFVCVVGPNKTNKSKPSIRLS